MEGGRERSDCAVKTLRTREQVQVRGQSAFIMSCAFSASTPRRKKESEESEKRRQTCEWTPGNAGTSSVRQTFRAPDPAYGTSMQVRELQARPHTWPPCPHGEPNTDRARQSNEVICLIDLDSYCASGAERETVRSEGWEAPYARP